MGRRSKKIHSIKPGTVPTGKRKHLQITKAVRDNDTSIQRLADKVPAAIFIFQGKKNRLVNPAAEALTGYTRKELLRMDFWQILHPDYKELVKERGFARQRGASVPSRYEVKIIRKDGEERWLDYTGGTIKFRSQMAVIGTAIDITERKRAEEQAQSNLSRLSALNVLTAATTQSLDLNSVLEKAVKSIVDLFHFDGAHIYLFNESMEAVRLRASYEVKSGSWFPLKAVCAGEGFIGRAAKTGEMAILEDLQTDPRYEKLNRGGGAKKAGARFLAALPIQSKLKSWGALACTGMERRQLRVEEIDLLITLCNQVAIAIEDATLFQQTAEKAKELSALYAIAASSAEVLDINMLLYQSMRKVLDIFGFTAARIYIVDNEKREIRLAAKDGFPGDMTSLTSYPLGEGLIGKVVETGLPLTFEDMQNDPEYHRLAQAKIMLKAGFRASFFIPLRVRGETLGVMNLVSREPHTFSQSDIQLINAIAYHLGLAIGNANIFSQLRQRTLDLEKANKSKDEFLSVMSHELRTPLNVIMGFTQLMQEGMYGDLSAELQNAVTKVTKQTKGLLAMIESILFTTRIEAGAVKLERREINVAGLLEQLKLAYDLPLHPDFRLIWNIASDLPPLNTDDVKLKHILQNLIDNAIKFTEQGQVSVSARYTPEAKQVEFSINDTGIGIEREKIPAIFEMFRQVDSSETRVYGGVGLGLYIVKKWTELLGGTVKVESEIGKGSTFTVAIPLES
jgi:PAS domain S-box-containing protein